MFKKTYLLILSLLLLGSCSEPVKSVLDDWVWVESTGGLLPPITPENSGQSITLKISRDKWILIENGIVTEDHTIKIKRRSKGLIIDKDIPNGDKVINFLNDDEITITYYGGKNTDCQDCSVMRFIRASN